LKDETEGEEVFQKQFFFFGAFGVVLCNKPYIIM